MKYLSAIHRENILDDLKFNCPCATSCIDHFQLSKIIAARHVYHTQKETEKLQWLIDILCMFYDQETDTLELSVLGKSVCHNTFLAFYGITPYKYYEVLKRVRNDNLVVVHGNSERDYDDIMKRTCVVYLQTLVERYGDVQPDSDEVHLPQHTVKAEVYDDFILSIKDTPETMIPSQRTFYQVWSDNFPLLIIPPKIHLGSCDECALIANQKLALTRMTLAAWKARRKTHQTMVRDERSDNCQRIAYAQTYKECVTLLGIDRMNAIHMPWQMPFPKSWLTKNRLRYEVIPLIDFGHTQLQIYQKQKQICFCILLYDGASEMV